MNKNYSIAVEINRTELLLAGIITHAERLAKRGINNGFITRMSVGFSNFRDTYAMQQALKARLMEKVEERRCIQAELQNLCSEARKLVKIEFPEETWREFGIIDQC